MSNQEKKKTNPWMIIGWIILGVIVVPMVSCTAIVAYHASKQSVVASSQGTAPSTATAPALTPANAPTGGGSAGTASGPLTEISPYKAKLIAFECGPSASGRYLTSKVTIQNVGDSQIPMAEAMIQLSDRAGNAVAVERGYFGTIPQGSIATAAIMRNGADDIESCAYIVQDIRGRRVEVEEPAKK